MICTHLNCLVYHPDGICRCEMQRYCDECRKLAHGLGEGKWVFENKVDHDKQKIQGQEAEAIIKQALGEVFKSPLDELIEKWKEYRSHCFPSRFRVDDVGKSIMIRDGNTADLFDFMDWLVEQEEE